MPELTCPKARQGSGRGEGRRDGPLGGDWAVKGSEGR